MSTGRSALIGAAATLGIVGLTAVACGVVFFGSSVRHDDVWILGAFASIPASIAGGVFGIARSLGATTRIQVVWYVIALVVLSAGIVAVPHVGEGAEREAHQLAWIFGRVAFLSGILALPAQRWIDHGLSGRLGCVAAGVFALGCVAFVIIRL